MTIGTVLRRSEGEGRSRPGVRALLLAAAALTVAGLATTLADNGRDDAQDDRLGERGDITYAIGAGGPALFRPASAGRRSEPDRRHEPRRTWRSPCTTATSRQAAAHRDRSRRRRAATRCTRRRSAISTSLKAPAMFTPATTTGRTAIGRPTADSTRSSASTTSGGLLQHSVLLGQRRFRQEVQTDPLCLGVNGHRRRASRTDDGPLGDVTYVTLNVQGSCNNLCDTAPDPAEYAARNAGQHRMAAAAFDEATRTTFRRHDGHLAGQSRLGPLRSDACAAPRPANARPDRRPARRLSGLPAGAARAGDRLQTAGRLSCTATRTTSGSTSPFSTRRAPARELHAGRDVRRQRGERQQRRAMGEGARRPATAATSSRTSRRSSPATEQRSPRHRSTFSAPSVAGARPRLFDVHDPGTCLASET